MIIKNADLIIINEESVENYENYEKLLKKHNFNIKLYQIFILFFFICLFIVLLFIYKIIKDSPINEKSKFSYGKLKKISYGEIIIFTLLFSAFILIILTLIWIICKIQILIDMKPKLLLS